MKILFTGGASGGHFYPIIAIAQALNKQIKEQKLYKTELFYMSTNPYNEGILFENGIIFKKSPAGKQRIYFSFLNFLDIFKTAAGVLKALWMVFNIFPDVVFGKGGYASFPALMAAKILRIPVVIHESDTTPGRVNKWASKFAKRIAISYPEAAQYFPKEKVALTGNPVRKEITEPQTSHAKEFFELEEEIPTILVLGGSQGAEAINNIVVDSIGKLLDNYQIIHQTGERNFLGVKTATDVTLLDHPQKKRYKPFGYLDTLQLRMATGAADIVISRAGSTIFEIASWGKPSIIIPITESNDNHQRKNAFSFARTGAAYVIEEKNLSTNIFLSEIDRIFSSPEQIKKMSEAARTFFKPDAAEKIANEILSIALRHQE
ncbi:MAG: undecaprenyldiphospho-muramoylpentapeptide beta-N-acetylglucosaminyltransferase [Candidatus Pacebacteria bacterium]|nr:undecaprenyldiphospho-muramoylpentapeptide beta-N-acetylglucosaminyltransferase [Candidatus Paceibacterota bacterium]